MRCRGHLQSVGSQAPQMSTTHSPRTFEIARAVMPRVCPEAIQWPSIGNGSGTAGA
jgi:hypothetical protein